MTIETSKTEKKMEKKVKKKQKQNRTEYPRNVGQLKMCKICILEYQKGRKGKIEGREEKRKGSSLPSNN